MLGTKNDQEMVAMALSNDQICTIKTFTTTKYMTITHY